MQHFIATISFYILLIIVAVASQAWALPLLRTDDADIVADKTCQIEQSYWMRDSKNYVDVTPACNILNQFELSVPLNSDDGEQSYALQVKKPVLHHEYYAVAASVSYQPKQNQQEHHWAVNVPVSLYIGDQWQVDINAGVGYQDHHSETNYAIASTYTINSKQLLSLEAYKNDDVTKGATQLVYHYHIQPEKLALFASYGRARKSDESSWLGLGLSWEMGRK